MSNLPEKPVRYLSRQAQAQRYGKSVKTLMRWSEDPAMGMPREFNFSGLFSRREDELEEWERGRIGLPTRTNRTSPPPRYRSRKRKAAAVRRRK